jgi:predicted AAA+ superfamily ATPase
MMSKRDARVFARNHVSVLTTRLRERRRFLQVVAGPRQVGKTTLVQQALGRLRIPSRYVSADEPTLRDRAWLTEHWDAARIDAERAGASGSVLAVDEVQKISGWSETVKRLWDEDARARRPLKIVLLGSAPLLVQRGLTESLAGRFEIIHVPHWSFREMRTAFGFDLDHYLYFGGYPGAAPLAKEPRRWTRYIKDALIETTIARDVLLLSRVDKPALLRRLFELACGYSGQILSYTKMLGQLQDAGNTTTLAHYLDLLAGAGMVIGLQKYAGSAARRRGSSPKLQVLNTALIASQSGLDFRKAREDRQFWGRLVESAVGAHLANAAAAGVCELFYWRERNREVDFVVRTGRTVTAIEVKSGRTRDALPGMTAFAQAFKPQRSLLVGDDGIAVAEFLQRPAEHWVA